MTLAVGLGDIDEYARGGEWLRWDGARCAKVRAREGAVIAVATLGDKTIAEQCHRVLWVPDAPALLQPLLTVLPIQMLSYAVALARGNDVDQPRNLAKSVTVE